MVANYYTYAADWTAVSIKFEKTLKVSSITSSCFTLTKNSATPVLSPFKSIDIRRDFDTISRALKLYFAEALESDTDYTLTIQNLKDATSTTIPTTTDDFTTGTVASPYPDLPPDNPPIYVEDKSIRSEVFLTATSITTTNPNFYIKEFDPEDRELMVENDYNSGRIIIKFSQAPSPQFINNDYFKAQRKIIQRQPARWEIVDIRVSRDHVNPWVYIDFPSTDATPVYLQPDKEYYEDGYKYRIKILKDVGV